VLTISKPLSAGQAGHYYAAAFSNATQEYYAEGEAILGRWEGRLRETFGLPGEVQAEHFARLSAGRHPIVDTPLIRVREVHRAGWDLTFGAPKSVSLIALVAGQEPVRRAHREAVSVALCAMESYTQARMGGDRTPETTGRWLVATFEHDSARPVNGYSAPHLHSHNVLINVTRTEGGQWRALQPRELFKSQRFGTTVYRAELAARLQALGYAVERGRFDQPEIVGFSSAYLEAASPRTKQILDRIAAEGRSGDAAEAIAQKQTRAAKTATLTRGEVRAAHQAMAQQFGNQPALAVEAARITGPIQAEGRAASAVTYARDRQFERTAVTSERHILTDALRHGMGSVRLPAVERELAARIDRGEFLPRQKACGAVSNLWTIPAMVEAEQAVIATVNAGHSQARKISEYIFDRDEWTPDQRAAITHVLASRDRIVLMDGIAGSGKTTAVRAVREAAQMRYSVIGVAPTSRAAERLAETGMPTQTLQRFLSEPQTGPAQLIVVDEASLASTRQIRELFGRLRPEDRVLLVGDVRQHQAVEAGIPFQQIQDAGTTAARLTTIRRQGDPRLRAVVSDLAHGRTRPALDLLREDGRIHVIPDVRARLQAVTAEAVKDARDTLVVVPDNPTRAVINTLVHRARQERHEVSRDEREIRVLVPRQDMTRIDHATASMYTVGDVVRFRRGSRTRKIPARSTGIVTAVSHGAVTVDIKGRSVAYDPARLTGVSVYREDVRGFAVGDRVQFTAPDRQLKVANRQLATIQRLDDARIVLLLDSGKTVALETKSAVHLDYGYAMTSYSAQGLTTGRVLVHVDADHAVEMLVNRRLAYVALSRGKTMDIFTDDEQALRRTVSRDISHPVALLPSDRARIPA
jgi:conjugative relaxase-like TrwC/TraI family protein